jgi:hypothetical protein
MTKPFPPTLRQQFDMLHSLLQKLHENEESIHIRPVEYYCEVDSFFDQYVSCIPWWTVEEEIEFMKRCLSGAFDSSTRNQGSKESIFFWYSFRNDLRTQI